MRLRALFAALALGAGTAACGSDRACFTWGEHEGACPAQQDALDFMTTPGACGERVVSVDSGPDEEHDDSLNKNICCYDVTIDNPGTCSGGLE